MLYFKNLGIAYLLLLCVVIFSLSVTYDMYHTLSKWLLISSVQTDK